MADTGLKDAFNAAVSPDVMEALGKSILQGDIAAVTDILDKHPEALNEKIMGGSWAAMYALKGSTPLMYAANEGNRGMIECLLKRGAGLEGALAMAAWKGHRDMAELLLDRGSDIEERNCIGQTPLIAAAQTGSAGTVNLLLERGADMGAKDNNGWTAADAARYNYQDDVTALLDAWQEKEKKREEERNLAADIADFSPALKQDVPVSRPFRFSPKP